MKWIKFLRQYGPIARNDNMYDETIQRSAKRAGVAPISFDHPQREVVLSCFSSEVKPLSVILTGTAGDGKTHLCRQVWAALNGSPQEWNSDDPYINTQVQGADGGQTIVHFIRDLSAWVPQRDSAWEPEKASLLQLFCRSLFDDTLPDLFLIAANDGQLVETWRRLPDNDDVIRARGVLETLLVEDRNELDGVRLKFFNLSRGSSADLLDLALDAFISHEGWQSCYDENSGPDEFFGECCPIRHNYEVLQTPLFRHRLRSLFELCDYNGLHIPIRQILLLLSNITLGHPDVKDRLMSPTDVSKIIRNRNCAKASIYNNVFGGNLTEARREAITIFDYLDRFRIGYETSNRIDNILIYGGEDETIALYYQFLLAADSFYGADDSYRASQREYVESPELDELKSEAFLDQLVSQRRGLFFKIPHEWEEELGLWELTVFKFAGEYLSRVVGVLKSGGRVGRPILPRLVKGLNRVFVGMLVTSEQPLLLATSLSSSTSKVSRILSAQISVAPRLGEKVEVVLPAGTEMPNLVVSLSNSIKCGLQLNLTRYEFLSRVAEGALPGSFSRECNEDLLAFKSQLLSRLAQRQEGLEDGDMLSFRLLSLNDYGNPTEEVVEVANV